MQTTLAYGADRPAAVRSHVVWRTLAVGLAVFGMSLALLAVVQFASPAQFVCGTITVGSMVKVHVIRGAAGDLVARKLALAATTATAATTNASRL